MNFSEYSKILSKLRYLFPRHSRRVLFEHVPKCGGTTVLNYLKSQYPDNKIFAINGSAPSTSIKHFLSLPEEQRYSYHLILGHGAHQLRRYVHPQTLNATILRDPVDRIVSHYYYVLRSPEHYLHREVVKMSMSLLDYATSSLSGELRNNYVCRFLQISPVVAERNAEHSIARAYDVLMSEYAVTGVLDNLNAAMSTLARIAYFRDIFAIKKLNLTADRPALVDIDRKTLQAIANVNYLDVKLYELVKNSGGMSSAYSGP